MIKSTALLLSFLILTGLVVVPASAWTLDSGYDSGASIYGGVRYRAFNNIGSDQVYVGIPPVPAGNLWGPAKNDVKARWNANTTFTVTYKPLESDPNQRAVTSTAGPASYFRSGTGPVNYLEFVLVNFNAANSVDLYVTGINGEPVSWSFAGTGTRYWSARGTGAVSVLVDGFIVKRGIQAEPDASYAEIRFGYLEPKDEQVPLITNVQGSPNPVIRCSDVTVTATIDDAATGGSAIASAEYSTDGGSWTAMSASDGAFDEVSEEVTATLATDRSWAPGAHSICVRGTDGAGNPGDGKACNAFTAGYSFDGFYPPVAMADTNSAKAGQAIPAKWTLTDNCGVIEDPASFSSLYSYPVTCGELSPALDVVEEYAGSSGLQYSGDGLWQFNWKTPKTYSGTCRVMHVGFDDGRYSDTVAFEFR